MQGSNQFPMRPVYRRDHAGGVLVVGLGNLLLGDDGVGVHAVRRLATIPQAPAFLTLLDGGTLGFRLMEAVAQSDAALFIDAAELDLPPGSIRLLERYALDAYTRHGGRISAHEAGLIDLLTLARMDGWATEPVALALPSACRMAIETARRWRSPH